MTTTWVLVPGTPILLPGVAGAGDPAAELRGHAVAALRPALDGSAVTVLAGGPAGRWDGDAAYEPGRLTGAPVAGPSIPLALAVGRALVRAAGWTGPLDLRRVADPDEPAPSGVVVAVGDGTLFRHPKGGPGPLDPRSAPFDEGVRAAVAAGDAEALAHLDDELAAALGVTGRVPWRLLGRSALGRTVRAELHHAGDPFGPYALVASWRLG